MKNFNLSLFLKNVINDTNKLLTILISIVFICLFCYSAYRTWNLSLTHDEALTYQLVKGNERIAETANHHPVNTFLVRISTAISNSFSEPALRFPNLVALAVYLFFSLMIIKLPDSNRFIWLAGIPLLAFNQYFLDFFSVARGYGIASGLSMAAIYFLLQNKETKTSHTLTINYLLAIFLSILASYSNYSLINLNITIVIISATELFLLTNKHKIKFQIRELIALAASFLINAYLIRDIAHRLLILKDNNELYFGGKNGLIEDTLTLLIHRSFFPNYYGEQFWMILRIIIVASVFGLIYFGLFSKAFSEYSKVTKIMLLMIVAPVMQHYIFGSLYPIERASIIYIPIYGMCIYFFVVKIPKLSRTRLISGIATALVVLVILLPVTFLFSKSMNKSYILEWRSDSKTKTFMKEIKNISQTRTESNLKISISQNWVFEPVIKYYKEIYQINNMENTDRDGIKNGSDYIYGIKKELDKEPYLNEYEVRFDYPDIRTRLLVKKGNILK